MGLARRSCKSLDESLAVESIFTCILIVKLLRYLVWLLPKAVKLGFGAMTPEIALR